jgi:hypothetical protein
LTVGILKQNTLYKNNFKTQKKPFSLPTPLLHILPKISTVASLLPHKRTLKQKPSIENPSLSFHREAFSINILHCSSTKSKENPIAQNFSKILNKYGFNTKKKEWPEPPIWDE